MYIFGVVCLHLLSIMLIVDGLLQLGGCGDRFGAEYKLGNWLQVGAGVIMVTSYWWVK